MKNFLVAQVWEGFEFVVVDQINSDKKGLAFAPSVRTRMELPRHTKRSVFDVKPLFPEYVFLSFSSDEPKYGYLRNDVKGLIGLVYCGDVPSEIRPAEMLKLIEAEVEMVRQQNPSAQLVPDPISHKLRLVVGSGGYAGLSGELVSFDARKREAVLEMELFGGIYPARINADMITNLPPDMLKAMQNLSRV